MQNMSNFNEDNGSLSDVLSNESDTHSYKQLFTDEESEGVTRIFEPTNNVAKPEGTNCPKRGLVEVRLQKGESVSDLLKKIEVIKSQRGDVNINSLRDLHRNYPEVKQTRVRRRIKKRIVTKRTSVTKTNYNYKPSLISRVLVGLQQMF